MSANLSDYALNRRRFLTVLLAGSAALTLGDWVLPRVARAAAGPFVLPPLPYAADALSPVISANTIGFHYTTASTTRAMPPSLTNWLRAARWPINR